MKSRIISYNPTDHPSGLIWHALLHLLAPLENLNSHHQRPCHKLPFVTFIF